MGRNLRRSPMSILGTGITDEQAETFVAAWSGNPMSATSLLNQASINLANALAAELEAKRPIQVGDYVRPTSSQVRTFTVLCIHDGIAWLVSPSGDHDQFALTHLVRVS